MAVLQFSVSIAILRFEVKTVEETITMITFQLIQRIALILLRNAESLIKLTDNTIPKPYPSFPAWTQD